MKMKLTELKIKEYAYINKINLKAHEERRLFHLGFYPGTKIRLERIAPFGDPYEFEVCGNFIILRKKDAAMIEVSRGNKNE